MPQTPFTAIAIDAAYHWVRERRRHFPADADIWHLRFHWGNLRQPLIHTLQHGTYRLSTLTTVTTANGDAVTLWSATDALVIHCLTQWLQSRLPVHPTCEHVRGHGGGRGSVARIHRLTLAGQYRFVYRTDIRQYYAHIDKPRLLQQMRCHVPPPVVLDLMSQFLYYSVEREGLFHTPARGMTRGSALSPLLAAFHLYDLDVAMTDNLHIHYVRYMDDILILTDTRWHLRHAVSQLNRFLTDYGFTQHPDKTVIERIANEFDWLGFTFNHQGCNGIAPRAINNYLRTRRRLYEQVRRHTTPEEVARRMAAYRRRWRRYFQTDESVFPKPKKSSYPSLAKIGVSS